MQGNVLAVRFFLPLQGSLGLEKPETPILISPQYHKCRVVPGSQVDQVGCQPGISLEISFKAQIRADLFRPNPQKKTRWFTGLWNTAHLSPCCILRIFISTYSTGEGLCVSKVHTVWGVFLGFKVHSAFDDEFYIYIFNLCSAYFVFYHWGGLLDVIFSFLEMFHSCTF